MSPEDYSFDGVEGGIPSHYVSNKSYSKFTIFYPNFKNTIRNSISKIKSAFKKVESIEDCKHRIDDTNLMEDIHRIPCNEQIHRMKHIVYRKS